MKMKQFGISMLFAMVLLTVASAPWSGQQGNGSYDPWLDYDDNGSININELHRLGQAYGSVGDAARARGSRLPRSIETLLVSSDFKTP